MFTILANTLSADHRAKLAYRRITTIVNHLIIEEDVATAPASSNVEVQIHVNLVLKGLATLGTVVVNPPLVPAPAVLNGYRTDHLLATLLIGQLNRQTGKGH